MTKVKSGIRHHVDREPVSFTTPKDWEVWEAPDELLFLASAPEEETDTFEAQVSLTKENVPDSTVASGYMMGNYVYLAAHMSNFRNLGSGTFPIAGVDVAWLNYSSRVQSIEVTAMDFYVVAGPCAYIVHCKAPSKDFAKWKSVFEGIGKSILIEPGERGTGEM